MGAPPAPDLRPFWEGPWVIGAGVPTGQVHTLQFLASHSSSPWHAPGGWGRRLAASRARVRWSSIQTKAWVPPSQGGQGWLVQGTLGDLAQDPVSASPSVYGSKFSCVVIVIVIIRECAGIST